MKIKSFAFVTILLLISSLSFANCIPGSEKHYRDLLTKHKWSTRGREITTNTICDSNGCHENKTVEFTDEFSVLTFSRGGRLKVESSNINTPHQIDASLNAQWSLTGDKLYIVYRGETIPHTILCAGDDRIELKDEDGDDEVFERA